MAADGSLTFLASFAGRATPFSPSGNGIDTCGPHGGPRVELCIASASHVSDHGGSLLVCVEGTDQLGFLATLLTRLAKVALFPVELRIATISGRVSDRLWLRCPGGRAPDADALSAVTLALRPILRPS